MNTCRGRGKIETSTALKKFANIFGHRGIAIISIHAYNEFEYLRVQMSPMYIKTAGCNEHVGDIERLVRLVKERYRCTTSHLLYRCMTRIMINNNIEDKIHWLNIFAPEDYILSSISPAGLVLEYKKPQANLLKLDLDNMVKPTTAQTI